MRDTNPAPTGDAFDYLTTAELVAMNERAWREAGRCWTEYRRELATGRTRLSLAVDSLYRAARSAELFWTETRHALLRRSADR